MSEDSTAGEAAAAARGSDEDSSSCLKLMDRFIPLGYAKELKLIFKIAGPVVLSQTMAALIGVVSLVFCGHLGKTELAGVSLATAVINVSGISIGAGLTLTCDTFISQTYGSGNLKRVGVILQRGILILLLACFPCWAVLINTEPLLLAVKQSPEVASLSQLYVRIFMPALPAVFMYQLQGRYLQNQEIIWPQVVTGAAGNVFNAIINYVFLYPLELGVRGSAAANTLSQYFMTVVLYIYICWKGLHKATWGGWSLDCLQEWGPFVRLAIPSMLMLCLEWWIFEIGGFLAGLISEADLAAQAVVYQLTILAFMFPLGLACATGVRVGNALGAGDKELAKRFYKVSISCAFTTSCLIGASFSIPRKVIGYIFTTDQDVLEKVSVVMVLFGFMHVADATVGVAGGVLRGAGKQSVGALCNLVGYYCIGFPIGVSLMFATNMGILGFWTGLTVCATLQAVFLITFLHKFDWTKAAEQALVRAGVKIKEGEETVQMENTESNESQAQVSVPAPSESTEEDHTHLEVDAPGQIGSTTTVVVGGVLPVRQLVLRRGLTLLIMVAILVAGLFSSYLLARLFK